MTAFSGIKSKKYLRLSDFYFSAEDTTFEQNVKRFAPNHSQISSIKGIQHINPAGFDITIGNTVYVSDIFSSDFQDVLDNSECINLHFGEDFVLKSHRQGKKVYYFSSDEEVQIPSHLEVIVDAKSTTGRVGCMCHQINSSFGRNIVFAVQPYFFNIEVRAGITRLVQAIVRFKNTNYESRNDLLKNNNLVVFRNGKQLDLKEILKPEGLEMTYFTHFYYTSKECDEPIDMDLKKQLDWRKYFERSDGNDRILVESDRLYLIGTREDIKLKNLCGRLSRESSYSGTGLWSHFAGFFMPGFEGEITLEVMSSTRRIIHSGDSAGIVIFDRVEHDKENNESQYSGSYQGQKAPKLPKMFKDD